jgi:hypothetical protein
MNDDQLYYFLVDKNTRNVLQIEYPSDIDEFNKILGTSEGKGNLLKDLGIILNSEARVFTNPEPVVKQPKKTEKPKIEAEAPVEKKPAKKTSSTLKIVMSGEGKQPSPTAVNLFAGLFD